MDQAQIAALLNPAVYPVRTGSVQHLQTHISHLFLTDEEVYKIKKPVDFGFLDFTTLELRHHFCREELRLNRRLSPDIYREVVALRDDGTGGLRFDGTGAVREYAVRMRRMPAERMMSRLLDEGRVAAEEIDQIAARVASFHAAAACDERIAAFGSPAALRRNWEENLRQTEPYRGRTLSAADHRLIGAWALQLLDERTALFAARQQGGFIRECDGDLHSENICLDGQVHIFDCIEFSERFRMSDTSADVAFLAMDLEQHGRRDLAERFVERYQASSGDAGLRELLPFYLVNRAFIRGKVESFRLDDPLIPEEERQAAAGRARRFFRLARGYILRQRLAPTLLITCGASGCGKSVLARELAFELGLAYFNSDSERKQLAGIAPTERGAAIYDADWNRATYDRLLVLAAAELAAGRSVVLDATWRRREERQRCAALAADQGARLVIMAPVCPPELVQQRLLQRQEADCDSSDGTWQIYLSQAAQIDPPQSDEGCLVMPDARLAPEQMVEQVLQRLGLSA